MQDVKEITSTYTIFELAIQKYGKQHKR